MTQSEIFPLVRAAAMSDEFPSASLSCYIAILERIPSLGSVEPIDVERIAETLNKPLDTVRKRIARLESAGIVKCERYPYRVIFCGALEFLSSSENLSSVDKISSLENLTELAFKDNAHAPARVSSEENINKQINKPRSDEEVKDFQAVRLALVPVGDYHISEDLLNRIVAARALGIGGFTNKDLATLRRQANASVADFQAGRRGKNCHWAFYAPEVEARYRAAGYDWSPIAKYPNVAPPTEKEVFQAKQKYKNPILREEENEPRSPFRLSNLLALTEGTKAGEYWRTHTVR